MSFLRRHPSGLFLSILAVASGWSALAACVGDAPITSVGNPDANAGVDSSAIDGATTDAAGDAGTRATVDEVAAGNGFACALLSDHTVMCWGRDDFGQAGQPAAGDVTCSGSTLCREPTRVAGLTNIAHVAAGGGSACAISRVTGAVSCWGVNDHGQLGHSNAGETCPGGIPCAREPVPVAGLLNIEKLAIGVSSACSIDKTGHVKCWGSNATGELARLPLGVDNPLPQPVAAFDVDGGGASLVAANSSLPVHFCASRIDGSVLCWGRNTAAELGSDVASTPICDVDSGERCSTTPLVVHSSGTTALQKVTSIAAVGGGTCVSLVGGDVWCWGYDGYAVTGAPVIPRLNLAPALIGSAKLSALSGALTHVCGLAGSGVPECWGINEFAELGVPLVATPDTSCAGPSHCSFPMQAVPSIHATSVVANVHTSFAITTDHKLYAWGSNGSGGLGHVPTFDETKNQCPGPCSPTPVEIVVP